jgi:hypothetical protein
MTTTRDSLKRVVRPERFELPTLWFEAIFARSSNFPIFNHPLDDATLKSDRPMCSTVRKCGRLHVGSLQKSLQSPMAREVAREA